MLSTYNSDFVKEEEGPFTDDIPTNSVFGIRMPVTLVAEFIDSLR